MSEEERDAFVDFIARHPTKGDIICGTGGLRKVRWGVQGSGKSGGARIVYYYHNDNMPLFLLTAYKKSEKDSLTDAERTRMKGIGKQIAKAYEQNS